MTRSRDTGPDIIYRPELQPIGQRTLFSLATLVAWVVWMYLFLPLLSLGAWWLGIEFFRQYMLQPGNMDYLLTLTVYAVVLAVIALLIFGWSRYNELRFGGRDRRKPLPPVTNDMLAEHFGLESEMVGSLQRAKFIKLDIEEGARLHHLSLISRGTTEERPCEREEIDILDDN